MKHKIADKILIILITIAAIIFTYKEVTAIHVASLLLCIFVSVIEDVISTKYTPYVCEVIIAILMFINPIFGFAIIGVVYPLMYRRELPAYIAAGILSVLLLIAQANLEIVATVLILSIVAGYIGFNTSLAQNRVSRSISQYDEARKEALESVRKRRELREKTENEIYTARLKERNRIAREIHDNVGHMITRVIVQMQAIRIINKDPVVGAQLESVSETLDLAMTGIRKSVHELHDDSIDLAIVVNDLARTLPDRFDATVSTSIESPADNNTKSCILGIIKEAITNISKHSKGDKVRIEVVENKSFWRISIIDNGKCIEKDYSSFAGGTSDGHGIGIENIYERAKSMGGRATIKSDASGFMVMATIPKKEN